MVDTSILIGLIATGAVAGFLSGLLGIGGGLIIVPAFVWALEASGQQAHVQHLALGTSLALMVFTSFSSVLAHHRRGAVNWEIVKKLAPFMVLGTFFGAQMAAWFPSDGLKVFFVMYAYAMAVQMLLSAQPKAARNLPSSPKLAAVGGAIGAISSLVGIGGGTMSVPFMLWCSVEMRTAIATSAALGWPIAFSGALGYLVSGWNAENLPEFSFGFIYLPAFLILVCITPLIAPLGVKMAHRLPVPMLKKVFACLLFVLASEMLYALLK